MRQELPFAAAALFFLLTGAFAGWYSGGSDPWQGLLVFRTKAALGEWSFLTAAAGLPDTLKCFLPAALAGLHPALLPISIPGLMLRGVMTGFAIGCAARASLLLGVVMALGAVPVLLAYAVFGGCALSACRDRFAVIRSLSRIDDVLFHSSPYLRSCPRWLFLCAIADIAELRLLVLLTGGIG